ncbi:MAG: hypothetical protein GY838_06445 [bacterium]|nr:hypothetical protein [bacterium]
MNRRMKSVALLFVLVLLAGALVLGGPRSAVDWTRVRAVAMESDDWGFAGFVPDADAWTGLDREALAPGRFPPVYWTTTLEDSGDMAAMADLLAEAKGRDGLPAVLQANYVMASQGWDEGVWRTYAWPDVPSAYARPGLWQAVQDARIRGVWRAEFHATWHYDPDLRRTAALEPGVATEATGRGITLFPGSEQARELGPWRERAALEYELESSLARFEEVFGRPADSIIAPDYTWNSTVEDMWQKHTMAVIQGKREQRNPDLPRGMAGRVLKLLGRKMDALVHPDRIYLERNCRFEPVQEVDPAAAVQRCAAEVASAWTRGEPAVIETHRVNFVHTDPEVEAAGRSALASLLAIIGPGGPVYLTDDELAQIGRNGVSRTLRGRSIVLRNATGSRRVVTVPRSLLRQAGGTGDPRPLCVAIPAGGNGRVFVAGDRVTLLPIVPRNAE